MSLTATPARTGNGETRLAYATVGWAALFLALHIYWAGVGDFGLGTMPELMNTSVAGTSYTLVVAAMFVLGPIVPLAVVHAWGRIVPRWMLFAATAVAGVLLTLRGVAGLADQALRSTSVLPNGLTGLTYQQLIGNADPSSLVLFLGTAIDAYFLAGGLLYGTLALRLRRQSAPTSARGTGAAGRDVALIRRAQSDVSPIPYPTERYAAFAFVIFALCALLANIDRQVISLLVEPIRRDLGLSDTQIGLLQGPAFALFYAAAGLPLGWLADRTHRRNLLVAGVIGWTLATAASAFATNFTLLLLCRIAVGIGEGALVPTIFSMLGDSFRPHRRAAAFGWFTAVVVVSSSIAMSLGGALLGALARSHQVILGIDAHWQLAFLWAAAPGPFVAAILLCVREPLRQSATAAFEQNGRYFRTHWKALTLLVLGLAGASGAFQLIVVWFPTVLIRVYEWPAAKAGGLLGVAIGVSAMLAASAAALLSRRFEVRGGPASLLRVLAAIVPVSGVFVAAWLLPNPLWALLAVANVIVPVLIAYSLSALLLQSAIPNSGWGRIAASFKLTESITAALSALIVGMLSDRVFVEADGIRTSLALGVACVLFGSGAALLACRARYADLLAANRPSRT